VGRISPEKGVHILIDAFGIVLKKFPDTHLQFAGGMDVVPFEFLVGISDDERVRDLVKFYQSSNSKHDFYYNQLLTRLPAIQMQKISFLGYVPTIQIQDVYHSADIFINSSLSEALGMPILEAMASGIPVIGSEVGGIPELIRHGETGLLFQPGDPDSLAESIFRLIEEENLRQNLKTKAFQEIKRKYTWEKISEELIHKYQSLLDA
jgi:glycosyltransferase involved in cell wall biosynthesis